MTNNDSPPSYDELFGGENVPPPKYEDIFGEGSSTEIRIEIPPPSQNENQQIQAQ